MTSFWTIAYRPLLGRIFRRTLAGRLIDPAQPQKGRILASDGTLLLAETRRNIDRLLPEAQLDALPDIGSRHNAFLSVLTVSVYHALLDFGVPEAHARTLVADTGWQLYATGAMPYVWISRLRTRDPQERLRLALRMLIRFPFSAPGRPGYELTVREEPDAVYTTWTCCPPLEFVRDHIRRHGDRGELELFQTTWCQYDWAFNALLAGGDASGYERPHTMSEGDPMCDMRWSATAAVEIRPHQDAPTPATALR